MGLFDVEPKLEGSAPSVQEAGSAALLAPYGTIMNQANERAWVNVTLSAYSIVVVRPVPSCSSPSVLLTRVSQPLAAALTGAVFMQAARYLYDREKGFRKDRWLVGTVTAIICPSRFHSAPA